MTVNDALIQNLTASQFEGFVSDFNRLLDRCRQSKVEKRPTTSVLPGKKYGNVRRMLGKAEIAARQGNEEMTHFFRGIACAFHGLTRLADAHRLEESLGPALGMAQDTSAGAENNTNTNKKEIVMQEIQQKQFAYDDLVGFLEAEGIQFMSRQEDGAIMAGFSGNDLGPVNLVARVNDQSNALLMSFRLPLTVPEDNRSKMAEAIARANYGLVIGGFELDLRDGELNYKVAVPTDEAMLTCEQLRHCLGAAFGTIDRYLSALYSVVFGDADPEDAIPE